jgi:hydrogen peroxide-dependent heme synthase
VVGAEGCAEGCPGPVHATAAMVTAATAVGSERMPQSRAGDNRGMSEAKSVGKRANELNEQIRYVMWSVFKVRTSVPSETREAMATEIDTLLDQLADKGVTTRGLYDVSGLRADADFMFWWVAPTSEDLQDAYQRFRQTTLGQQCEPVWSQLALHRPAEFNRSHIPAFLAGEEPKRHVCVYPFVRSYEWYLLPDEERRTMLAEHGQMAREYPDVRANTVAAFALGDYEWMLAFEADELHRIVDLMRHLRGAKARLHTREELPFYTGARKPVSELIRTLP